MKNVAAVLITYNPEISLLKRNLNQLCKQIDTIIIYDNNSKNQVEIQKVTQQYSNIRYYQNKENLGLPRNYNKALQICRQEGIEWLLTMDQDTVITDNMMKLYWPIMDNPDVAIISPVHIDYSIEDIKKNKHTDVEEYEEIDRCISSAALNRVNSLIEIGGFDEKMFIDYVDFDICQNVINHGYKIIQVNTCFVEHSIGHTKNVRFLWKKLQTNNHAPIRKYYFFRNKVYFSRKYNISIWKNPRFYRQYLLNLLLILYENNRMEKLKMAFKGIYDGMKM